MRFHHKIDEVLHRVRNHATIFTSTKNKNIPQTSQKKLQMLPNSQHMCSVNKHSYSINIFLISNLRSLWSSSPKLFLICVGNHTTTVRVLYANVSCMLTCWRANLPSMLTCQRILHASVLMYQCALCAYVLACQHVSYAFVRTCQCVLHAYVLICQSVLCAKVSCVLTCWRGNMPYVLLYSSVFMSCILTSSRVHVLTCLACLDASLSCLLTCLSAMMSNSKR